MNRRALLFASCFIFSLASHAFAMNISVFGMLALPQGDFADDTKGLAETGYGGGAELNIPFSSAVSDSTGTLLYCAISGFIIHNEMDLTIISSALSATGSGGGWNNVPLLAGIKFMSRQSPSMGFYGVGQFGINIANVSDITIQNGSLSVNETFSTGYSFAFSLGAGVVMQHFDICIRYMGLGEPKQTVTASNNGTSFTERTKQPISQIVIMAGYDF
jgi:hypothetical protein